ncbi:MAG TPA: ABC transporter substrate-binding protein [Xanthobacteraceae bacterium]|jgi:putative ABC transport system substrate-binding protein|nr:ABC transporter substrate-binding protein [Xanthobacteraceae bacterium]
MKRRNFIRTTVGAGLLWPLVAWGQQLVGMRRIGVLMLFEQQNAQAQSLLAAFRGALAQRGWVEGRNIVIEERWAGTDPARVDKGAKELVALRPDLILSSSSPTTAALLLDTSSIPIIFAQVVDPVGQGFVTSMAHPGGNVTGTANLEASMTGKWVELLKEIVPSLSRVIVPYNPPTTPYANIYLNFFKSMAPSFGVQIDPVAVADMNELDKLAAGAAQASAIIPMPSGFFTSQLNDVAELMTRHRLPSLYVVRDYAKAGGLISYGNDITDNYRQLATFVDRILKGEKASDLPVQLPVKFEMVINVKTAKALGLQIPPQLLATADDIVE